MFINVQKVILRSGTHEAVLETVKIVFVHCVQLHLSSVEEQ